MTYLRSRTDPIPGHTDTVNGVPTWTFDDVVGTVAAFGGAVAAWFAVAGWDQARRGRRNAQRRWEADVLPAIFAVLYGPHTNEKTFAVQLTNAESAARPGVVAMYDEERLFAGTTALVAHAPTATAKPKAIGPGPHGGERGEMLLWARDTLGIWRDMPSPKPVVEPPSDE